MVDIKTCHMKQHKMSHSWFSNRNIVYMKHHLTCGITLTSISSEATKTSQIWYLCRCKHTPIDRLWTMSPMWVHVLLGTTTFILSIGFTLKRKFHFICHQCFALPCECVQIEIMMKAGKGELKHWKYLMKEYNICTRKVCSQNMAQ